MAQRITAACTKDLSFEIDELKSMKSKEQLGSLPGDRALTEKLCLPIWHRSTC